MTGTRTKKRAVKSIVRRGERSLSSDPTPGRMLQERVAQLEAQVLRLGEAFDQNTQVFSEAFKMNEAITASLQRVSMEIATRSPLSHVADDAGSPDWRAYLRDYWLCMLMADFADWLKSLASHRVEEKSTLIHAPDDDGVVETHVFGG